MAPNPGPKPHSKNGRDGALRKWRCHRRPRRIIAAQPSVVGRPTASILPALRAGTSQRDVPTIKSWRRAAGLNTLGLPPGYRENPALLQTLPDEPNRSQLLRNPKNWIEKECLYCGASMLSLKKNRTFCSANCRRSFEFRKKNPLPIIE